MDDMMLAIQDEIPRLRRYALFLARDRDRADDLVQECLTRAISKSATWQPGTNLRAWLFTILRNGFISELRHARREPQGAPPDDDDPLLAVPVNHIARVQLREVFAALNSLSCEHREVLELVVIEELSYETAAEILKVPLGTVRSRLSRARAALRQRIEPAAEESRAKVGRVAA